jgi:carboxyl-terminal processing protease
MKAAIESLNDPYTEYFTEAEWNEFEDVLEQNYVGIGVRMEERNGRFMIVEVFENSPARKVGLHTNDEIVTVNGVGTKGLVLDDLLAKIKGPANTKVKIGILRSGKKIVFEMTRSKVQAPVVTSTRYDTIGYLDISSFSTDAAFQFTTQLKQLEKQGIKGLVIDLRNNGGGILEVTRQIAANFIRNGTLIYVRDRNNTRKGMVITDGENRNYPVAVLVNEWSASASEVLAGALKDYRIAKLVGTTTFGKGSVQDVLQLDSGGYLKVTTQEYLTPKQNKVNKVGIQPDRKSENMTAQLINGLRIAGMKSFTLQFSEPEFYRINGINGADPVALYDSKKTNFVHAELLTALTGSFVSVNSKGQLTWTAGGPAVPLVLPKATVLYQDKQWYLDINALSAKFPGVKWKKVSGNWQLSYQKAS